MRHTLTAEHRVYSFSPRHEPALTVDPGDEVLFETHDCMDNTVPLGPDPAGLCRTVPGHGNPATGPVAVRGAQPGMTLSATILEVTCAERGLIYADDRKTGVLQMRVPEMREGRAHFAAGLVFDLNPVVGVIGVAPACGDIPNSTPGRHGGNLDCSEVRAGATIHLPVTAPGGLFGCGDLHALQADGEVCGMGIEVAGEVLVRLDLQPRILCPWPLIEAEDHFSLLTAAATLDEAAEVAVDATRDLLGEQLGLPDPDTIMLQSMICDLQVNQIVDPLKGMRVRLPRTLLPSLRW